MLPDHMAVGCVVRGGDANRQATIKNFFFCKKKQLKKKQLSCGLRQC